ncbi:hypothetical protein PAPYR_11405 [Paratrimastix pyriformis]|uniref:Uncharacterized protein n=1 Tax=Paratrimastix pyriformis TaxID=342808 RepID=A0ABQ8U3V1_9EUKA|nr:hypothetical protein PAPYR_11405 [Paratrimastix pyriformis]
MHPRVSHTGIEAPAKLAVSGCSSDIMCAVTPTPEGGSVLAYDRHPKTGTLADLHRWLSHEGDPLYIRMPYANGCIYPQGACSRAPTLLPGGGVLEGGLAGLWCTAARQHQELVDAPPVLPTWKVFEFGIFAFSIGQLTMSSETHSVEDAGAVPLTLESVEAEANRQRMEAAGKKRVAEKSQAEEQGEKKEKVMAETMRFAIKFEPSAVQFSWYELECQLREILGEARVQQGLEEGTFGVTCLRPDAAEILGAFASRNQAVLTDLGSECERPASAVTFVTMRAHLGGLPLEAKEEEVRQWLREANPSAQCLLGQACSPAGCMACVCDMLGGTAPHPGDLPGQAHSTDRSGEDRPLRADHRLAFIRAAGVEWPQQMQEYLKNHHIVVEVSDIWRSEVAWSSGRWDGTFCVMATPEQREAIDALKRESRPRVVKVSVGVNAGKKFK